MIPAEWIQSASLRIAPHIRHTLLEKDLSLNIYLKWENMQVTGSFKVRGALNKIFSLASWEQNAGLVTASAGNHGQGVALAGQLVGAPVIVFVSNHAVPTKIDAMRSMGAEIRFVDGGYELAEKTAMEYSLETSSTWISPYNDGQVIAGQGTIGLELLLDLQQDQPISVVVPVGGGGLLSGIGAVLDECKKPFHLIGVNAAAAPFMHALFTRGSQEGVIDLPTLADGLTGAVESGSISIPLVRRYADDIITVDEDEIGQAITFAWKRYHQRIEGSGAVGLAAILSGKVRKPAVVVITGGNIPLELHAQLCNRYKGI